MTALTFNDLIDRVTQLRDFSVEHYPGQVGLLDQMTTWTEQELAHTYDLKLTDEIVAHVATAVAIHLMTCGRRTAHTDFPESKEQQAAAYGGMIEGINGILQRVAEIHGQRRQDLVTVRSVISAGAVEDAAYFREFFVELVTKMTADLVDRGVTRLEHVAWTVDPGYRYDVPTHKPSAYMVIAAGERS